MKINDYIDELFADIPDSDEKRSIIQEICMNLEEKVQDLMEEGKSEEDAVNKSIVEFGNAQEIRQELLAEMQKNSKGKIVLRGKPGKVNHAHRLWYSVAGSILIILLAMFINLSYSPKSIWFVYPTFVVLWWPLTMFFVWLDKRGEKSK